MKATAVTCVWLSIASAALSGCPAQALCSDMDDTGTAVSGSERPGQSRIAPGNLAREMREALSASEWAARFVPLVFSEDPDVRRVVIQALWERKPDGPIVRNVTTKLPSFHEGVLRCAEP